jgi:hypothetical protein
MWVAVAVAAEVEAHGAGRRFAPKGGKDFFESGTR